MVHNRLRSGCCQHRCRFKFHKTALPREIVLLPIAKSSGVAKADDAILHTVDYLIELHPFGRRKGLILTQQNVFLN